MKFTKKGQAALEFLTTYGWAFLVILVMIGALGYFGILSPGNFLPQRCNVGPEFTCDDYQTTSNGTYARVSAILKNNIGESMKVKASDFTATSGTLGLGCKISDNDVNNLESGQVTIPAGGQLVVQCTNSTGATSIAPIGQKVKFLIQGKYTPIGKKFQKPITAEVYATLQKSSS